MLKYERIVESCGAGDGSNNNDGGAGADLGPTLKKHSGLDNHGVRLHPRSPSFLIGIDVIYVDPIPRLP